MDCSMIDAASGGALMDKTPTVARLLISKMASNTQNFEVRGAGTSRNVSKVSAFDGQRLEHQLTKLTSFVSQYQRGVQCVYGICTSVEHPTDMCLTLQESETKSTECVGALGGEHQYGRQSYANQANTPAESKSDAVYNAKVWASRDHVGFELSQLSTAQTNIPGTAIPPTTAPANSTMGE
ncbi:hypothetical protein CR513_00491, partial [Mucuna pruriens]